MRRSMLLSLALACLFCLFSSSSSIYSWDAFNDKYDQYIDDPRFWHNELTVQINPDVPEAVAQIFKDACMEWEYASQGGIKFTFLNLTPPYPHAGSRKWWNWYMNLLPETRLYGFDIWVTATLDNNSSGASGNSWYVGSAQTDDTQKKYSKERKVDINLSFNPNRIEEDRTIIHDVALGMIGDAILGDDAIVMRDMGCRWENISQITPGVAEVLLLAYPPGKVYPVLWRPTGWKYLYGQILRIEGNKITIHEWDHYWEEDIENPVQVLALPEGDKVFPIQKHTPETDSRVPETSFDISGAKIGVGSSSEPVLSIGQLRPGDKIDVGGDWGYQVILSDGRKILKGVVKSVTVVKVYPTGSSDELTSRSSIIPKAGTDSTFSVKPVGKLCTTWGALKAP